MRMAKAHLVTFLSIVLAIALFPMSAMAASGQGAASAPMRAASGKNLTVGTVSGQAVKSVSSGTVTGKVLDGVTVRFRPQGSYSAVAVKDDGTTGQNTLHMYHIGGSSRFYLEAMSDDSYRMFMYSSFEDTEHKSSGNCIVDISNSKSYKKEGGAVHVVSGNWGAENKQWKLIRQGDGSYYIQNVKSGMYWSLDNTDNIDDDSNKVVQRSAPMKWEIEIVSRDSDAKSWETVKAYDSYNFIPDDTETFGSGVVTGMNWMTPLPDARPLSELSIPGTHDAATCSVSKGKTARCQQLYVNDQLRAGVRYLDLRFSKDSDGSGTIVMRHGSAWCHDGDTENNLKASKVMGWIKDFLADNPGETVIIQVKDNDGGGDNTSAIYSFLKGYMDDFYIGDHVPLLGEARGKVVIISRLDPSKMGGGDNPFNVQQDGKTMQWALDAHDWQEGKNNTTALAAGGGGGDNFEVWTQDNYNMGPDDKWDWVEGSLTGSTDPSYRRDTAMRDGRRAWVVSYTSCAPSDASFLSNLPQDCARDINKWLKRASWMKKASFLGVVCSDYTDQQLTYLVYRCNFDPNAVPTYTVSFESGDGSGSMESATVEEGAEYQLPRNGFTAPERKAFRGWKVKVGSGDEVEKLPGEAVTVTANTTATAQWSDECAIVFMKGDEGAGGSMEYELVGVDSRYTLPKCGFTAPKGKAFSKWSVKIGSADAVSKDPGDSIVVTGHTSVTAIWVEASTVTLEPGAGVSGDTIRQVVERCSTFTLPTYEDCEFSPPNNWAFTGWLVQIGDADAEPKAAGETIDVTADTTATATWEEHEHSFTYAIDENDKAAIVATCSGTVCTLPNHMAILAVEAPKDLTYDGTAKEATVVGDTDVLGMPDIFYKKGDTNLEGASVDAGRYTASMTLGGVTASVDYAVKKAPAVEIADVELIHYSDKGHVISVSVAGKMPADAGTLTYTAGTATTTRSLEVSDFTVDGTGTVRAILSNGSEGDTVTLPVTISSTNYRDSTVNVKASLVVVVYTVVWLDGDGSVLQTETYDGEQPSYTGKTPTKAPTAQCSYAFIGWDEGTVDGTVTTYRPLFAEKGTLTFDLAGGTLDGKAGSIVIEANVGDTIEIPKAPTRDGCTFKYWKGSEYYPGDKYKVEGNHTFTAVWEDKSDEADSKSSSKSPGKASATAAKGTVSKTGDGNGLLAAALFALAAASLCIVVLCARKRRA